MEYVYDDTINTVTGIMHSNEKLKDRAIRIVSEIAGVKASIALETLMNCEWKVKTAITMLKCKLTKEQANDALRKNCGVLRRTLKSLTTV